MAIEAVLFEDLMGEVHERGIPLLMIAPRFSRGTSAISHGCVLL